MAGASSRHVTVVGAGIVGTCCALALKRDGHQVTLIDHREPGTATSFGNAGVISVASIMPYSTPGLWKAVPGMLLDPLGPLALRWRYLPRALPWLLRFLAEGRTGRAVQVAAEMAPLTGTAVAAHGQLMAAHGIDAGLVRAVGYLHVWRDARKFDETLLHRQQLAKHGIAFEELDGDGIAALEPGLSRSFRRAIHVPGGAFAVEPVALTRAYAQALVAGGGEIRRERVRGFGFGATGPDSVTTDAGSHRIDALVVAAGAWSRPLLRMLGSDAPLESERGYHLTLPSDGVSLSRPVIVGYPRYSLAPMRDGVRITSGAEFAGLDLPPDFRRIHRLLPDAREALPGLGGEVTREWMGHRPALPDSKPVIGPSPHHRNVFFAFGHGHLGLTLSAVTAAAITDLVAGRQSPIPLAPFAITRF